MNCDYLTRVWSPSNLIDVSDTVAMPGPLHIAASVFLPDPAKLASPPVVIFAFPGGGYSKGYFDVHPPGHRGYSQAEHHTGRGIVVVAADHLGVGASSIPDPMALSIEMLAAANDAAIRKISTRLAEGSLAGGFPPLPNLVRIAIGQSMGGCITIVMQGRMATCDAIACLGFSAIHTVLPQRSEAARQRGIAANKFFRNDDLRKALARGGAGDLDFVYPFHWEDVPGHPRRRHAGRLPDSQNQPAVGKRDRAGVRAPDAVAGLCGAGSGVNRGAGADRGR